MATSYTRVKHHYDLAPADLFARLAEHENLSKVFPAKVTRLRDGDTERNGVGSVRKLRPVGSPATFQETVTRFEPDSVIEYKVTKGGGPLRDHLGTLTLTPSPSGGTDLDYTIRWESPVPGVAPGLARILTLVLRRGLPKVATA